jgi:hypothetical protein
MRRRQPGGIRSQVAGLNSRRGFRSVPVVMMMMVVIVIVIVIVIVVVSAAGRTGGQSSVEERRHQFFHGRVAGSGADVDPLAGEEVQGALPDPARDDHLDPVLAKPAGEQARLVIRGGKHLRPRGLSGLSVDVDQRELAAAAEVSVQAAVIEGDRDLHELTGFDDQRATTDP